MGKSKKRRNKITILLKMLGELAENPDISKTDLFYKVKTSHKLYKEYLEELKREELIISYGLLNNHKFRITTKGRELLSCVRDNGRTLMSLLGGI